MKMNNNILKTTYVFIGLFTLMIVYLLVYIITQSDNDINNPYNKRDELLAENVVRGKIYSRDMQVLAKTETNDDGSESRVYLYGDLFCHAVGSYDMGEYGLESSYNFQLLTSDASIVEEIIADLNNDKLQGNSLVTTLDVDLQSACYNALGNYDGAVVVMDSQTGEILSMVSNPGYDPNDIEEIWDELTVDSDVLVNRATQGLYPPGSVFKLLTLGEYISSHADTYEKYEYDCQGSVSISDLTMSCSNKKAHGNLDLLSSFAKSCNCSFVNMGTMIEANQLKEYCENKLFNSQLPLDIAYKQSAISISNSDTAFMKAQTVIGQGETLVTPMHMCMVISSIANDGILMKPKMVSQIIDKNGKVVEDFSIKEYKELFTKDEADILKQYLRAVVENGTASSLNRDDLYIYGKTGTAQVGTEGKANSWFVGVIEKDDNKYAIAVVIENVDDNTAPAVSVTKEITNFLAK